MEIIRFKIGDNIVKNSDIALLLGNFDGVHLGHASLADEAKKSDAKRIGVLLFSKDIHSLLDKDERRAISSLDDRIRLFSNLGVDVFYVLETDYSTLKVRKDEFIDGVLKKINPHCLVVGDDFRFGRNGEGDVDYLKKYFKVVNLPLLNLSGKKISSESIIASIKEGKMEEANKMLGRPYEIKGVIEEGLGNGKKIGFPTANLSLSFQYVLPSPGVYITISYIRGIPHYGVTNVGNNPTIGILNKDIVETHLFSFSKEIYGETMYVAFLKKIRDEIKFDSLEELKAQMEKDAAFVKKYINSI